MDDLFDLLVEFRDFAVQEKGRTGLGGLLTLDEKKLVDVWRPDVRFETPWLSDAAWPANLRTVQHQIVMLKQSEKPYAWQTDDWFYRSGCTACGWTSQSRDSYVLALGEGLDHAFPDWWKQPIVNRAKAGSDKGEWGRNVARMYPPGWFETGGPVRTHRFGYDSDPEAGGAPGGGWDMPGTHETKERTESKKLKMFAVPTSEYWWNLNDLVLGEDGELVAERDLLRPTRIEWANDDDDDDWEEDDDLDE